MKKSLLIVVLFFVLASVSIRQGRADTPVEKYNAGDKVLKGFVNVLLGWTEVFQSPIEGVKKHGPFGFFSGIVQIPGKIIKREVSGANNIVTFLCPEEGLPIDYPFENMDTPDSPGFRSKMGMAAGNTAFGWTETIQSPIEGVRDHGPLGLFSGLVQIPFKAVVRTTNGINDIVTSSAPEEGLSDNYPFESTMF